ncbi:acetate/propionate family kinase [Entomobacter blattae]|uniref:Acetate kinase n=1 Tax=Entomobacter blattae TaxID=2762277 RepID=A0A7H1NSJ3_9PROT|nr:acetate/propionate family kinase [Entomobacter blattae]QNT78753.1 Acetate kinase [Entomobacter blattae]
MDAILVLNSGSSSMKFSLFEIEDEHTSKQLACGLLEGIGTEPYFKAVNAEGKLLVEKSWGKASVGTHQEREHLVSYIDEWLENFLGEKTLRAVGHRVVHGGAKYIQPTIITDEVLLELERLTPFVPLHQPGSLAPIYTLRKKRKDLLQIACFDTSFHHTMPDVAKRLAIPRRYFDSDIRRYGFHGLSYQYIADQLKHISPKLAKGRVVVAHLGNGASLCAIKEGIGIETTMSFTALDGLVMGTRCGRIDPGVLLYMMREQNLNADQISDLLYRQSGLLGVSGISNDMRELRQFQRENNDSLPAKEALDLFSYRIVCEIGSLVAALGGLDGIVFTAGIGENDAELRERVCHSLAWLGIELDVAANNSGKPEVISTKNSQIEVRVIRTNEEQVMLKEIIGVINGVVAQPVLN